MRWLLLIPCALLVAGCEASVLGLGGQLGNGGQTAGAGTGAGGGGIITIGGNAGSGMSGAGGRNSGSGGARSGAGGGSGGASAGTGGSNTMACPAPETLDPGRVTIRRLNRTEYNNTVRDLFDDNTKPADDFPADDFGYGFNNIADVLSTAPVLIEKYDTAAKALVTAVLARESPSASAKVVVCDVRAQGVSCARTILTRFGRKAWRRPLTTVESDRYQASTAVASLKCSRPSIHCLSRCRR